MKLNRIILRNILIIVSIFFTFIACDKDFATIDSDIINEETATNFNTVSERFEVLSYTDRLSPVQTNGLSLNLLGVYNDPANDYEQTIASVVAQLNSSILGPDFGTNPELESVELSIPFFSRNIGINEDGESLYELDSVFPNSPSDDGIYSSFKLSIFENNYFLRDFDPNDDFDTSQSYFSNKSASSNELISESNLEAVPIAVIDELLISNNEIVIIENQDDDDETTQRFSPRIREFWSKDNIEDSSVIQYWSEKIIEEAEENPTSLSNSNNFNDYFRGLYFKAEAIDQDGSLLVLNLADSNANITLTYSFDSEELDEEGNTVTVRDESTYVLTFNPTRINFFENNFTVPEGDASQGDERLFLKGPNVSTASINLLFNSTNTNSTVTNFSEFRNEFANYENGEFESYKRLINEANLIFYVDEEKLNGQEPDRLFIYDKTNNIPLVDYFQDNINNTVPQVSLINHLGVLERVGGESNGDGIKYKMRITSHITNLLLDDAENVELGLAISGNVNIEATVPQYIEQTSGSEEQFVPGSSIINPRGTVLFGNRAQDENKRLYLEIFYTCLENCPNNN